MGNVSSNDRREADKLIVSRVPDDVLQAVLDRADLAELAVASGFRRGHGKAWHCGIHQDKTPSASLRGRRLALLWMRSELGRGRPRAAGDRH